MDKCKIGLKTLGNICKIKKEIALEMYNSGNEKLKEYALGCYKEEELKVFNFPKSLYDAGVKREEWIYNSLGEINTTQDRFQKYDSIINPFKELIVMRDIYRDIEGWDGLDNARGYVCSVKLGGYLFGTPFNFKLQRTQKEFEKNFAEELELYFKIYE